MIYFKIVRHRIGQDICFTSIIHHNDFRDQLGNNFVTFIQEYTLRISVLDNHKDLFRKTSPFCNPLTNNVCDSWSHREAIQDAVPSQNIDQ